MEVWASVDIMSGKVVRLVRGDPKQAIVYGEDPVFVAQRWERLGFDGIHVVDLDAALGKGSNFEQIKKIAANVSIPIQVGGGIRSVETVNEYLRAGIRRLVLGTVVFKKTEVFDEMLDRFGSESFIVALDFKGDRVVVEGWKSDAGAKVVDAIIRLRDKGIRSFLLTDVERDGTLTGPNLKMIMEVAGLKDVSIYAAGGISSIEDAIALGRLGVRGIVLGRAIYEGKVDVGGLLSVARGV